MLLLCARIIGLRRENVKHRSTFAGAFGILRRVTTQTCQVFAKHPVPKLSGEDLAGLRERALRLDAVREEMAGLRAVPPLILSIVKSAKDAPPMDALRMCVSALSLDDPPPVGQSPPANFRRRAAPTPPRPRAPPCGYFRYLPRGAGAEPARGPRARHLLDDRDRPRHER